LLTFYTFTALKFNFTHSRVAVTPQVICGPYPRLLVPVITRLILQMLR